MNRLLRNMRLSKRLAAGFGLVLLLLLATMVMALVGMRQMSERTRYIVEVSGQRVAQAQAMMNASSDVAVALYGFMLVSDDQDAKAQADIFKAAIQRYEKSAAAFAELVKDESPEAAIAVQLKALGETSSPAMTMGKNTSRMVEMGGNAASSLNAMDPRRVMGDWRSEIGKLVDLATADGTASYAVAQKAYNVARVVLVIVSIAGIVIGALASILILRSVTVPLKDAVSRAQAIATGDLSGTIESTRRDEVGELLAALAGMQDQLRDLVGAIRSSTDSIAHASAEIAHGNLDLSQRTERTAAELQRAAGATAELSDKVRGASHAAQQAGAMAHQAEDVAHRGGAAVGEVVQTMGQIDASARQISEIIGVIDGIAFQTNILALNAAVEAARAGEQGRGFAVVAGEVRALAQRSAEAAKQIKTLIGDSSERVSAGTRQVQRAGSTMDDIVSSVLQVGEQLSALARDSAAQNDGIAQLESMVSALDQMTQSNAALVEQGAAAADSLQQQAAALAEKVSVFQI